MSKKAEQPVAPDREFGINWQLPGMPQFTTGPMRTLQRRQWLARWNLGKQVPRWQHRKELIKAIWPEGVFAWNDWTERRMKNLSDHCFTTWIAGGGCVRADTRIDNPITGERPTIKELHDRGEAPYVMTIYGPQKACVPFIKGHEQLYEVKTADGNSFVTTAKHRVLTPSGYRHVCDLHIGDILPSWTQSQQRPALVSSFENQICSISEHDPLTRGEDGRDSLRTTEGFQGHYSPCFHPYDERPLSVLGGVQSSTPLQVDAPKYSLTSCIEDDRGGEFQRSLVDLPLSLRATTDFSRRDSTSSGERNPRFALGKLPRSYRKRLLLLKSVERTRPLSTSEESEFDAEDTLSLCDTDVRQFLVRSFGFNVADTCITSITAVEKDFYYDITVPGANHYFAEGTIHHNTGKTTDAAVMALEWWLEAPQESAVIVCSTTKEMLRTRIWGQIVHYHAAIPKHFGYVGELLDTACFIRFRDGDWKNGIKGIAVQDGPIEEAINNIIGMHTSRVFVILDEAQGVREAIMKAIPNLLKNPESRMHLMGNPDSFTSLLCRYGAPIDGWDSIPKFAPEWETKTHGYEGTGQGLFFDGRQSPAVLDPEWGRRNPWMTSQRQIDAHLESVGGNENDPSFMTQTIGWPPSMGVESTVLDGAILNTFHCQRQPMWTHGKTACAAIDPAFNGGDKAILQFGWRGWVEDEDGARWVIAFGDTLTVPIDAESDRPVHYQILDFCKAQCQARNIPPHEFAIAAAGEGGGLKSIFDMEWGNVIGIEEGGSPSERKAGAMNKTARESYDTRASELCFLMREFALGNGLRGLPEKAADQLTKRQTFHRNGKWCAEPKSGSKGRVDVAGKSVKGFKQRMGYSPDEADACQILAEHCRLQGAEPGTGMQKPKAQAELARDLRAADAQYDEGNYATEEDWREYATL